MHRLCWWLALLLPGPALASGFLVSKMGGDLAGPTEPNAAAVFWNPAALGPIGGASIMLDLNLVWRTLDYQRDWQEIEPADRPDSPGRMRVFAPLPMPALTLRPGVDWLTLGLAFYIPFGNRADWPAYDLESEMQKPPDQRSPIPPQAYQSLSGGFEMMYTSAAAAFCPLRGLGVDWFWMGIGASWIRASVDAKRLKDYSAEINEILGIELAGPEQMDFSGTARLDFSGDAFAFSVGLWASPVEWLRLGLSWTSGSKLVLPGQVRLSLPAVVAAALHADTEVSSSGRLHMDLPPAVRAGVHFQPLDWLVLRVTMEYVHWQLYRDIRIHELSFADENGPVEGLAKMEDLVSRRDFKNTFDARGGVRLFILPWWMVFGGLGYDTNAIGDETVTPDLYDAEKLGLSAGTWLRLLPPLELIFGRELGRDDLFALCIGFSWVHFFSRQVDGSRADPPIDGRYSSEAYFFNMNLEARF